ncbi:MAG: hypothetical protein ABJE95_39055 [Byssovorax sp.]
MNGRDLRTRFAVRALDFAETFNAGLGALSLQPGAYQPQLTTPDGPSTGGGVQAVQHVRLIAARQGFPAILVGSANQRSGTAELRSYEYIDAVHRQRWQRPVPLDRSDYEDFLNSAKNFFESNQLLVTIAGPPAGSRRADPEGAPATPAASGSGAIVTGVVVGLFIGALAIWLLLRRAPPQLDSLPSTTTAPSDRPLPR